MYVGHVVKGRRSQFYVYIGYIGTKLLSDMLHAFLIYMYIALNQYVLLLSQVNASLVEKSNFLKEIELMKRVSAGRCQYVVNTIGSCTFQEPLALVLEYMPYGDLLTYLRTSRNVVKVCSTVHGVHGMVLGVCGKVLEVCVMVLGVCGMVLGVGGGCLG